MDISHALLIQQTSLAARPSQGSAQANLNGQTVSPSEVKASEKPQSSFSSKREINIELSQQELVELRELRIRDREVRAHEQAHAAVAGSLARGGPSYDYQRGPDGRQYAVGGSVSIDTSAVSGDPKATLDKAQQIKRAALAPAQPSAQDRAVAAAATAL